MFSPAVLGALIPIVGIMAGIVAIWTTHQRKMRQIELDAQFKMNGKANTSSDISTELQQAIKGEFERLREDNVALHQRLTNLEKHIYAAPNAASQQDELAKQQRLSQNQ